MNVLFISDKHGDYVASHPEGVEHAALGLLMQRLDEGWYYNWDDGQAAHQWEDRAAQIVDVKDADAALSFLEERSDHEYEYVEVQSPKVFDA